VIGIAAELQYVPLGDAHVLDDLPWCVWHALYLAVYELDREAGDEVLEVNMRTTTAEQKKQVVTKQSVFSHRVSAWYSDLRLRDSIRSKLIVNCFPPEKFPRF
jgi:hypothetical protein